MGISMRSLFEDLCMKHDVIVVSGALSDQIRHQVGWGWYYRLAQNGAHALDQKGELIWKNKLNWREKYAIFSYIMDVIDIFPVKSKSDLVQDRGCQVSYSIIGHNEDLDIKEDFDPTGQRRKDLLTAYPFEDPNVKAVIGGTTCIDFIHKKSDKGRNILRLIEKFGWDVSDCLYVGDALFEGGNDESVIGVIPTEAVASPQDTEFIIRKFVYET